MLDKNSPFLLGSAPPGGGGKRGFAEERLRQAVVWCELEPGAVVSELKLIERYGLNRAGVRAALVALEARGLVEALPRHGWRVRPISGAYVGDVVAARRAVEPTLPFGELSDPQIARVEELTRLISALLDRREAVARASLRAYDRELVEVLASGLGEIRRRWLHEAWDHSERLIRFFERGGRAAFPAIDRTVLATACAARDVATARAEIGAAIDAFEAFVIAALCADDGAIVRPAAAPERTRSVSPRAENGTQQAPNHGRTIR